ncbi:MAG: hypothetical protein ACTHK2_04540 [Dokdonella sp.]|uniref:hypothetical protein n=1 Tax=Dokdonella sp. TaxID=2291710 RepID=UPI003F80B173
MTSEGLEEASDRAAAGVTGLRFMEERAVEWTLGHKLALVVAAAIALLAGVLLATRPVAPVREDVAPAPQVQQADGSVIAQRAPDAHPAPPRHQLPRGAVEERREQIVVAPAPAASTVEVDLSLVRQGDERRVVASSPDGQVLRAIDIPIEPAMLPPPPLPWAAGLSYRTDRAVGLWVERDIGHLRLGAELAREPNGRAEAEVRVGLRF